MKPTNAGIIGSLILTAVYFTIVSIANSFSHAISQFILIWPWMVLLIIGFGFQIGLFTHIKHEMHNKKLSSASASIATTGGISTTSMVACCMHHLTDVLPLIGLSAAVLFFNKYQIFFLSTGIFSNLIGISVMFNMMQKHNLTEKDNTLNKFVRKYNMNKLMKITIISSVLLLLLLFILI